MGATTRRKRELDGFGVFRYFFRSLLKTGFLPCSLFSPPSRPRPPPRLLFFTSKKISYLFFCRAALEALSRLVGRGFYPRPSILHVHDWQACAAAMLYWHLYAAPGSGSALAAPPLASIVLTIHNFDSSGECRQDEFAVTGVDGSAFATIDRALDERTIGHNPERLCLLKVL